MKLLYLHGLNSRLSAEKRTILERLYEVDAPDLDYENRPEILEDLRSTYRANRPDVIIGSSMGGFVGYLLSAELEVPALLFNPALPRFKGEPHLTEKLFLRNAYTYIVLGRQDDVVPFDQNLHLLLKQLVEGSDIELKVINKLAHRIPIPVFEKEVQHFFAHHTNMDAFN